MELPDIRPCSSNDDCENGFRCNGENKVCEIIEKIDDEIPEPEPQNKKKAWYNTTKFIVLIIILPIATVLLVLFSIFIYNYLISRDSNVEKTEEFWRELHISENPPEFVKEQSSTDVPEFIKEQSPTDVPEFVEGPLPTDVPKLGGEIQEMANENKIDLFLLKNKILTDISEYEKLLKLICSRRSDMDYYKRQVRNSYETYEIDKSNQNEYAYEIALHWFQKFYKKIFIYAIEKYKECLSDKVNQSEILDQSQKDELIKKIDDVSNKYQSGYQPFIFQESILFTILNEEIDSIINDLIHKDVDSNKQNAMKSVQNFKTTLLSYQNYMPHEPLFIKIMFEIRKQLSSDIQNILENKYLIYKLSFVELQHQIISKLHEFHENTINEYYTIMMDKLQSCKAINNVTFNSMKDDIRYAVPRGINRSALTTQQFKDIIDAYNRINDEINKIVPCRMANPSSRKRFQSNLG